MNPLLFLGREFLHKMSGAEIEAEEREAYRDALAVYSESEDGRATPRLLIASFNDLREEEYRAFSAEMLLWFIDWVASLEDGELTASLEGQVLRNIWAAFDEAPVRMRVLEVALQLESGRIRPEESIFRNIFQIADADRELVMDMLRLENSDYARAVLRVIGLGS
jgi:predicted DNA-binding transcriptional regulator YafY